MIPMYYEWYGDNPGACPFPADIIRTSSYNYDHLRDFPNSHPEAKLHLTLQPGLVLRPESLKPEDRSKCLRQAVSLLAHEKYADLLVAPEDAPESIRRLFFGLYHFRLDQPARLDAYLREIAAFIADQATDDLNLPHLDTILLDTCAWTMPEVREFLGLRAYGWDLEQFSNARWSAFFSEAGLDTTFMGKGLGDALSQPNDHVQSFHAEKFGVNNYWKHRLSNDFDRIVQQLEAAMALIRTRRPRQLVINLIPEGTWTLDDTRRFFRTHVAAALALQAFGRLYNTDVILHADRPQGGAVDSEFWLPGLFPILRSLLNTPWTQVRIPLQPEHILSLHSPQGSRTLVTRVSPLNQPELDLIA